MSPKPIFVAVAIGLGLVATDAAVAHLALTNPTPAPRPTAPPMFSATYKSENAGILGLCGSSAAPVMDVITPFGPACSLRLLDGKRFIVTRRKAQRTGQIEDVRFVLGGAPSHGICFPGRGQVAGIAVDGRCWYVLASKGHDEFSSGFTVVTDDPA